MHDRKNSPVSSLGEVNVGIGDCTRRRHACVHQQVQGIDAPTRGFHRGTGGRERPLSVRKVEAGVTESAAVTLVKELTRLLILPATQPPIVQ